MQDFHRTNFCPFCGVDLNTVDVVIFAGFTICKPCWKAKTSIHKEPTVADKEKVNP